jgi:deoxyxylulose-5-phosphate synthase
MKNDNKENKALSQTCVSGSFFDKTFRKTPILISKNDEFKGWRAEIADTYENYKTSKYSNINFEDLGFHFRHNVKTHELDDLVFYTRKDAVKCAKKVIEVYKLNCKIWFL